MYVLNTTLNNPIRSIKAKVELFEGSTLINTFNYTDALQAITIERAGENSKFFGFGVCQKATIKLRDETGALNITTANHFKVYFATDNNYLNPYPDFKVSEVRRDEKTKALSITCYDKIYDMKARYFNELALEAPYSLSDVAAAIASLMGVVLKVQNVNDMAFELVFEDGANLEGTEHLRGVLDDLAEATQTVYFLNETSLVFKRLKDVANGDLAISKENYFDFKSGLGKRLKEICSCTDLGDNISAAIQQTGSTQFVRNNPFWDLREDRNILVENALTAVGGFTIPQFELDWRGDFRLEIGDCIAIQAKDDTYKNHYVLNDSVEYDGGLKEKTNWKYEDNEGETATNPSNLGEALKFTYAQVDKINKEISLVASEVDDAQETLASIQVTADGLSSTVQTVEKKLNEAVEDLNKDIEELTKRVNTSVTAEDLKIQVETQLKENGAVEAVTTTTGFTFNEEGLSIEKSGSEMSTKITEDGMTVYKDNEAMLEANNDGVIARNLHAETYLIIGKNSRFEDIGSERTACFWIGS